ncbi:MAG: transcriptional regulator [Planctomycetota bacterium]
MGERKPEKSGTNGRLRKVSGLSLSSSADTFDKLIHERLRLAIVSALAVHESLSFNELKELVGTTDGNLSVHARKLEEAGYVVCTKGYDGRVPKTEFALSPAGRRSLERYLAHMESLIKAVREK